ncbi:MAG TPA: hypothetical protein VKF14_03805 [Candidatus Dormibacteraeota bacterium]|nr:hypothetical protein [Candidatus Dormibacteraeota bacterium]
MLCRNCDFAASVAAEILYVLAMPEPGRQGDQDRPSVQEACAPLDADLATLARGHVGVALSYIDAAPAAE